MLPKAVPWIFFGLRILVPARHSALVKGNSKSKIFPLKQKNLVETDVLADKELAGDDIRPQLSNRLYFHRICVITLILQELLAEQPELTQARKVLNWMGIIILVICSIYLRACYNKYVVVHQLLNGLVQMEQNMKQYWKRTGKGITESANLIMAFSSAPVALTFPAAYVIGLHWSNPCEKTSLIGYWLLGTRDKNQSWIYTVGKYGVFILNHWVWTMGILAAVLCLCCIQALSTVSLRQSLDAFWNLESSENKLSVYQKSTTYRQIQLLSGLHNEVQSKEIMSVVSVFPCFLIPMATMILLRFPWTSENFMLMAIAAYVLVDSIIAVLFVLGGQAGVWIDSKVLLEKVGQLNVSRVVAFSTRESRWQKRFWKSCGNLIKVKFGASNFVDEETPLNCLNCAISFTVQLLLLEQ